MSVVENKGEHKILWVCWEKPDISPTADMVALSFLKPSVEDGLKGQWSVPLISAREVVSEVKEKALNLYIDIIAQIGIVSLNGMTFRKALCGSDEVSSWWFHKAACKDCESEPTFNQIIQILTIQRIAQEYQCTDIILCGGPYEIAQVLSNMFPIKILNCKKQSLLFLCGFSLLRRFKFVLKFLYEWMCLKRCVCIPENSIDILFSGFWDWSVKENPLTAKLEDRYFRAVPEKLHNQGMRLGWLTWFYNNYETNKPRRSIFKVIEPLAKHSRIIIAQCFLSIGEIFRSVTRFKPFFTFLRYQHQEAFKNIFKRNGLNFYPLLKKWLYAGFLDGTLPYHELICLAHRKAVQKYQPKAVVSFLNFFPYARALCAGVKKGCPSCAVYDMQHASYAWEDTIGRLDSRWEFDGIPDGCSIPHADYMFVMGELGRDIFMKSGFSDKQILLTGSSRYDEASSVDVNNGRDRKFGKNILIVAALNKELELEMVDCVYMVFSQFPDVSIHLRSHPFSDIRSAIQAQRYGDKIHVTSGTALHEDLSHADIVIFSYSTVAEEAFIQGVPVWQWISTGYNASAFRDIKVAPVFSSVKGLIQLYKQFLKDPQQFIPTVEQRQLVKKKCFYIREDGLPSDNIVEALVLQCGIGKDRNIPEQKVTVG